jgi:hypothetical protein
MCSQVLLSEQDVWRVKDYSYRIRIKQSERWSRDSRRGDNGPRRQTQCELGKLGEVGASRVIGGVVDFRVWRTGCRGKDQFEPDIVHHPWMQGCRIHVKTCNAFHGNLFDGRLYPTGYASWTVDVNDPLLTHPRSDDIIILMMGRPDDAVVYAIGWVYASQVTSLWENCVSAHMSHKKALYWHSVKDVLYNFN